MIYVLEDKGARDYMEDRHYIELRFFEDYDLYAVFDGHGNDSVAKLLRLYFKDILRNELYQEPDMSKAIHDAFKKMNDVIPRDIGNMAGSTALIALQNKTDLWIANVGDCRALINRGDEALQVSLDHKPNLKSEFDRIQAAGGFVTLDPFGTPRVNGNLALSRAFGDFYLSPVVTWIPDIFHYKLFAECEYVFMASDGVFDAVKNEEIVAFLRKEKSKDIRHDIRKACMNILGLARSRGSGDNITIVVAKII